VGVYGLSHFIVGHGVFARSICVVAAAIFIDKVEDGRCGRHGVPLFAPVSCWFLRGRRRQRRRPPVSVVQQRTKTAHRQMQNRDHRSTPTSPPVSRLVELCTPCQEGVLHTSISSDGPELIAPSEAGSSTTIALFAGPPSMAAGGKASQAGGKKGENKTRKKRTTRENRKVRAVPWAFLPRDSSYE
jgi:hypothetical protein